MYKGILKCTCYGLLLGLLSGTYTHANPNGAQVINGQVSFTNPQLNTLQITNSPGAIINWQQFSIQQNEITRFIQQSANSAVLNRVVSQDPSSILGQLLSNGRVFLINPNGIMFGKDAVIDTAGLIASTLDMTDEDFIAGHLKFQGQGMGAIQNKGYIKAGANANIFLIAPNIENSGIIETDGGQIILAAGESITIASLDSDHIVFDVQAPEHEVVNLGKLITHGGAARMFAGTIQHSGSINADSLSVDEQGRVQLFAKADIEISSDATITANGAEGGEVKIESDTGTVWNSGTIEAKGTQQQGGHVEVLGERVALLDEASIDVSGETGGGEVLVGGDYQGKNEDVKNAKQTYIGKDTTIKADAVTNGDGGNNRIV
ncbi:MAG: filamentous hemagglutinin N-terminal domain-containing protein [Proteobacteria bacterium]|nr:filamentous hemagglutinin N-terminal domain-containing protein [Pseudomonadota bacterium]